MYMKVKKSSVLKSICSCLLSHSKKSSCFWSSSYSPGGFVPISKHFLLFVVLAQIYPKQWKFVENVDVTLMFRLLPFWQ